LTKLVTTLKSAWMRVVHSSRDFCRLQQRRSNDRSYSSSKRFQQSLQGSHSWRNIRLRSQGFVDAVVGVARARHYKCSANRCSAQRSKWVSFFSRTLIRNISGSKGRMPSWTACFSNPTLIQLQRQSSPLWAAPIRIKSLIGRKNRLSSYATRTRCFTSRWCMRHTRST